MSNRADALVMFEYDDAIVIPASAYTCKTDATALDEPLNRAPHEPPKTSTLVPVLALLITRLADDVVIVPDAVMVF